MNPFLKMFRYIPGFRSQTKWKMLMASIYYLIALTMITESTGHLLACISIPFILFYLFDLLRNKQKGITNNRALTTLVMSIFAFSIGLMMIPLTQDEFANDRSIIQGKAEQTSSDSKTIGNVEKKSSDKKTVKAVGVVKPDKHYAISYNKATVVKNVDGDTVIVKFPDGRKEKVRFIGVNTPESVKPDSPVEPYGKEASDYTKSSLVGKVVYLEKDVRERDKYGRLLRYIWINLPEKIDEKEIKQKMFNAVLLLNGYAQQMTIPPDIKYAEYFRKFEREAREGNKGLWRLDDNEKKKESVAGNVYIQSVNLRKEIVLIKNTSKKDIDMTGCKLRSVKGNQTYYFPKGYILKSGCIVKVVSGKYAKGNQPAVLKWTSKNIWNNKGDPAELYDASGKMVSYK